MKESSASTRISGRGGIWRYLAIAGLLLITFIILFIAAEALGLELLTDPSPWLSEAGLPAGAIGVGLLIVDVVLPVPSSLVMIAFGALFGVVAGTLLSLAGGLGAAMVGFALGRRGGPLLDRLASSEERARADRLLERWGALAIIITRPVPLLAETVAILAGASTLGWGRAALAAAIGVLPSAFLYSLAGAVSTRFENTALIFGLVLLLAGLFWLASRWLESRIGTR